MSLRRRVKQIAGVLFLSVVGGCMAAHPIEDRRIGRFCDSVAIGSDVADSVARASRMFGIEIRQKPKSDVVVVKSVFTYKTLCFIETSDSRVVSALFSND